MSNTFAGVLRSSRLASFDRSLAQVYTTQFRDKRKGVWGMKRNLPSRATPSYVTLSDLDTSEHQTPFKSGMTPVLFVERWKENFPNSRRPAARREQPRHYVAQMSPQEFREFLKMVAQKRAPGFKRKLARKEVVPEQVYEYLGVTFELEKAESDRVVGPTYSDRPVELGYCVPGRVLNNTLGGVAVGVAGVVALLPRADAVNLSRRSDYPVRPFYVERAEFDEQGRPMVVVRSEQRRMSMFDNIPEPSLPPPTPTIHDIPEESLFHIHQERAFEPKPERIEPNPGHAKLMDRIEKLKE